MSYSDFIKTHIKHHRCVVCGRIFGAQYDGFLKTFPVYHPNTTHKHVPICENDFFKELIRLYRYIHESGESKTVREMLEDFPWNTHIAMRKEMLEWCMRQGYFQLNNMKRLLVPPAIEDAGKDLFAQLHSEDPEIMQRAIELVKAALRCFNADLQKREDNELPIEVLPLLRCETTLFDRIDTSNVELRSDRFGGATLFHQQCKHY